MKLKTTTFLIVVSALLACCNSITKEEKFFYPGQEWLDDNGVHINAHGGGFLFHDNKYFWYGEHKVEGEIGNTAQVGVHLYTSENLYDWKDEGIVLAVNETDPSSDIYKGCIIERPKVIFNKKTKKFVMWFHLEPVPTGESNGAYGSAKSGIAYSESPYGPFEYIQSVRPNAGVWPLNVQDFHKKEVSSEVKSIYGGGPEHLPKHVDSLNILGRDFQKGQMARDMTLFVDDNDTAYHIYSSEDNSTLHISQLSEDYLSHSGKYKRFFPSKFNEAPAIMKTSAGKYFIIASGCTGWSPNPARSAVSDHIFGPWKELGNPCTSKDSLTTYYSQSTYILPVQGKKDAFIFMADRWKPDNPIDGRYVWLPIKIIDDQLVRLEWNDKWNLDIFDKN